MQHVDMGIAVFGLRTDEDLMVGGLSSRLANILDKRLQRFLLQWVEKSMDCKRTNRRMVSLMTRVLKRGLKTINIPWSDCMKYSSAN